MKSWSLKFASIFGALTLWFFVVSDLNYNIDTELELRLVHLDTNLAVASYVPHLLNVNLEGKGLDLIKMMTNPGSAWLELDMAGATMGTQDFKLEPSLFRSPHSASVQLISINYPPNLAVELDARIKRTVPIASKFEPQIKEGFTLLHPPRLQPDSIVLHGARKVLMRINHIYTANLETTPFTKNEKIILPLELSHIAHKVEASHAKTEMSLEIQPVVTRTFNQVPVRLIGSYTPQVHQLSPEHIAVTISGPKSVIENSKPDQIRAFIEFSRFKLENNNRVNPTITYPLGVESYEIAPQFIELITQEYPTIIP